MTYYNDKEKEVEVNEDVDDEDIFMIPPHHQEQQQQQHANWINKYSILIVVIVVGIDHPL
eukprot:CAMPEP_0170856744 /NCGR_PEP_ID=MMETSP0734-20130129/14784_1 /TAXON_ID=186038 /ORGANISM="Fragilariopsis kerguelensis, Strain L26-C5" /LENGTH=59 /DNA_ID=CAMNT_0011228659 /DNA_START=72 /DNA_END=251 /DNA_ORIENTATION=+